MEYTLSGASITFTNAPSSGARVRAYYGHNAAISGRYADNETPAGTVDGANTAFTVANTPSPPACLELFVNGILQTQGVDYTLSSAAITFTTTAPSTGAIVRSWYRY